MNDTLLYRITKSFILYTKFIHLSKKMFYHIEQCPLEHNIKVKKLIKINKLIKDIRCIPSCNIHVHDIAYEWISYRWNLIVLNCCYIDISKTKKYIDFNFENELLVEDNMQTHIDPIFFKHTVQHLILPIHCKIIDKQNTKQGVKIYSIKPSLQTIEGKMNGLCIEYMNTNKSCIFFGILDNDSLGLYRNNINKIPILDEMKTKYKVTDNDITPYLDCFRFRDYLIYETRQIVNKIKQNMTKIEYYKKIDNNAVYDEFTFLPYEHKIELLTLLLQFKMDDKIKYITSLFHFNIKHFDLEHRIKITFNMKDKDKISTPNDNTKNTEKESVEDIIHKLKTSDKNKSKALDKLKIINMSNDGAPKAQKYLDGFLKIPFSRIREEEGLYNPEGDIIKEFKSTFKNENIVFHNTELTLMELRNHTNKNISDFATSKLELLISSRKNQSEYMNKVEQILNNCVHGHDLVKIQFKRLLAQWITGGQSGIVIGIEGPPGVGKTSLIKEGLAKCLLNQDNESRPVGFIPLGGSSNASSLVGHGYTYQGSTWGRIIDIIMDSGCMNPIFLFDELDKVSRTESGREVISILTHLTDSTQNKDFHDKYFEGVSLDVSKALMIFTFNNRNDIDPILLDRMTIIETKPLTLEDKKIITTKHLIPQISNKINIDPKAIKISNNMIESIIHDYTREAGVRQLKRILESMCQELNLRRLLKPSTKMIINNKLIKKVLYHKDKIINESISSLHNIVGQINGMYANALGLGGILPIQVSKNINDSKMELTGMQGDVMKESMICAKTNAYSLLNKLNSDIKLDENKKSFGGLHIHVPSAATPKDGPSAGGAISLAIYSFLSKKPIRTDVAMTGEIDLRGNIKAIGGLSAKLNGAKKAKIKTALIPYENKEQIERIRNEKKSPEDDSFKVILVKHIEETLQYVF